MKALVTADLHLSNSLPYAKRSPDTLISDRLNDICAALDWVIAAARDREMPLIILGDIFDRRQPDAATLKAATALFQSAAAAGTRIFMLPGNHDAGDNRGLHYVVETFGLAGMDGLTVMKAGETWGVDGALLCPVPSQSRAATLALVEQYRALKSSMPKILLIHDTVIGADLARGHVADDGLAKDDLKGFSYILAGHIHGFQKLTPLRGVYVGSPYQLNFNEVSHEPSIGMISTDAKRVAYHRIKMPPEHSRWFAEIRMNPDGSTGSDGPGDAPYFRLIYEGDDEALDAQRAEVDQMLKERARGARYAGFVHRGGPSGGRGRLDINLVEDGLPPIEALIGEYVKMNREKGVKALTEIGLNLLRGEG
jgi:DNA repair exonuclease SbcCD nuclease subunit